MNERYAEIDRYEGEFKNLIETSFDCRLEGMSTSASSDLNGPIEFSARFPSKNKNLKGTPYLYTKSKKLIHFTSVPVLFSIINEGAIRLYNLHNSNDKTEYSYASNKLSPIYELQKKSGESISYYIDWIKKMSFILSSTNLDGLKKLDFWKKYGDFGKGIAIEFEIINEVSDWEFFYCSEVLYDRLDSFDDLISKWEEIQAKYSHIKYDIGLNQILSLHKSEAWANEEEIRILTLYPDLHRTSFEKRVCRDFKTRKPNSNIQYFSLPLCDRKGKFIDEGLENSSEVFLRKIPRICISDIHYGPDFPISVDLEEFHKELWMYIYEKLNYSLPNISKSRVKL